MFKPKSVSSKPLRFICMVGLTSTIFLDMLRPERLTIRWSVSSIFISFAWMHKLPMYFFRSHGHDGGGPTLMHCICVLGLAEAIIL